MLWRSSSFVVLAAALIALGGTPVAQTTELRWVSIPGTRPAEPWRATFDMGCVPNDRDCQLHELPRHRVTLTHAFALLATEVTRGQFRAFAAAAGYRTAAERDGWSYTFVGQSYKREEGLWWGRPGIAQDDRHPVVHVTWDDAVAYCAWAGGRLPTEAEWEYAARGGLDGARFVWGDRPLAEGSVKAANVADEEMKMLFPSWSIFRSYNDGYIWTSPAGLFAPNGFGLWDMAGNVWEWVSDWYARNTYGQSAAEDPRGPAAGQNHVVRGASWGDEPSVARASERGNFAPSHRGYFFGFRCAR